MGSRTLLTVAEFEKLPDDGNRHELDEGELIIMPPPRAPHSRVQKRLAILLDKAVAVAGGSEVLTECGFRLRSDVIQAPDVALVLDKSRILSDRYSEFGPDLAADVLSPSDNAARLQRKIAHYFAAGTSVVWVLDPESKTVTVYEKSGAFRTLHADNSIDVPSLLPGFSVPVSSLFE
jgi:Uma2 family endonuclease